MECDSKLYQRKEIFLIILVFITVIFYFPFENFSLITSLFSVRYNEQLPPINCSQFGFGNRTYNDYIIYDFLIMNDEFDMLEIRLFELYEYVDLFLIAESNTTFTGKPKPLYLKDNWNRFRRYHNKMRRIEVLLWNLEIDKKSTWDNERRMRDDGLRLALPNSER